MLLNYKNRLFHSTLLVFSLLLHLNLFAQSLPVGTPLLEDNLRRLQVTGRSAYSHSLMIRPLVASGNAGVDSLYFPENDSVSNAMQLRSKPWGKNGSITVLPALLRQQYNSSFAYGWNDGAMIPAKGFQALASAGVHLRKGIFSLQLQPEAVLAASPSFSLFPQSYSDSVWYNFYLHQDRVDAPQRMGDGVYRKLLAGQSSARINFKKLSFGLSTENLWWGPGTRNALMMTHNAPGFPHLTFNTTAPVPTRIGAIEWQVIAGRLKGSGVLPQDTSRRINDSALYMPKLNDHRYINAFVVNWQPRWIKGLYLGFSRAFYQYESQVPQTLNGYFPVLGAWLGNSAGTENQTGGRDQLLSFSFRLVLPESKAELYGEYGRNDRSLNFRDILLEPEHSRAYVLGFRKYFATTKDREKALFFEATQLQRTSTINLRAQESWYTHYQVRHGYTHLGQVLGAGIGPGGSNSQTLGLSWYRGIRHTQLSLERVVRNNDLFFNAFTGSREFMRHWVDLSLNGSRQWTHGRYLFSADASLVRALNYQYRQSFTPEGDKDLFNLKLGFTAGYRF